MVSRNLLTLTVLACTGALIMVLSGHLWGRYVQVTDALEFGKTYERYQASQASAPDEATAPGWHSGPVREASAAEE
jgi:hypothetical protein